MDVRIQAIHFDATAKLHEFIEKKVAKLEKFNDEIRKVEVSLKVVKPETSLNKEASICGFYLLGFCYWESLWRHITLHLE